MGAPPLTQLLTYGQQSKKSPEEIATAIQKWRRDVLEEGRTLAKDDPEKYWAGSAKAEAEAQAVLTGLNEQRRQKLLTEKIPIPAEQKLFIDAINSNKGELPDGAPESWKAVENELVKAGENPVFQGAKGFQGKIAQGTNELGDYEVRQTPDGDFEALIKPALGDKKPLIKRFKADRQEILDQASADLTRERRISQETVKVNAPLPQNEEEAANQSAYRRRLIEESIQPEYSRVKFVEDAPIGALIHEKIVDTLREDEDFLKTIPQNRVQQFTTRPARKLYESLLNAGTGISDLVTGETSSGERAVGRAAYSDETSPGVLRSRFAEGGETFYDFASQGVESLATLYGPGAVLKLTGIGGKVAAAGGKAAEAFAATGEASGQIIASALRANPSAVAGWGNLLTTAYGANYGSILQEADALDATDPERANRIRSMAQFTAMANASLEMLSEKIIGKQEGKVFKGDKFGLLGIAMIPPTEAAEEVIGAAGQNVVGAVFDTGRESEDLGKAAVGGFVGAAPFAGLAAAQSLAKGGEPTIASPIKSEVGGAVLGQIPTNTPIEDVQQIVSNLTGGDITEGEQRRREIAAVDIPAAPVEDAVSDLPSVETEVGAPTEGLQQTTTSGDSSTVEPSQEQLSNEPAPGGESGVVEAAPTEDPTLEEDAAEVAAEEPAAIPASQTDTSQEDDDFEEIQKVIATVNIQKKSNLSLIEKPKGRLARFADEIAALSGRKVLYVQGRSGFDGVQFGKYLIVKPNSRQAIRKLIGHEFGHSLDGLPGSEKVMQLLKDRDRIKYSDYVARLAQAGYKSGEVDAEFFADAISEAINDRAFWRSLQQETDPTVFQKIVDAILTTIDKVAQLWKEKGTAKRPIASVTLNNLEGAREAIRELIKSAAPAEEGAIRESQEVENLPESRTRPTQEFGVKTSQHEVVAQETLHRVSDTILSPTKVTEDSYNESLTVFKSLRRANGTVKTAIRNGIQKEFADRLRAMPANERAIEALILEAQAVQVLLGNAMAVAAEFNSRSGKKNPKRAAVLTTEVKKLAFENILQVPGDAHTAARVLRSSQLEGGDLAALMHDLFDAASKFMSAKAGPKQRDVEDFEEEMNRAKPEAARRAAAAATPEGETYLKSEARQKGRVRTFVERMARWAMGRESRTVSPAESDLMAALTRLEEDYAGNIDLFEQLAREAIDNLPVERRDAALKELEALVEFDIELAEVSQALYEENRNLNRVVKAFIKKTLTTPKPKQKIQATADLAAWRLAVRSGKTSPEDIGNAFTKEGGDPTLKENLIQALKDDTDSQLQKEAVREDAKRAKKEYRDFLKEQGKKAAAEEDFQKRLTKIAEQASREASDSLIKKTGEETARVEDFQNLVQEAADQAAKEASDELMKEVGEEIARTEDFQKRLEAQAEKAADKAATKEAKRIAKMLTEGLEENLKAESDRLIEEIGKRAAEEEDLAAGVLKNKKDRKEGPKNISLTQVIMEEIESNPEWDVSDHADKVELIKAVLKRRGVAPHLLDETAEKAVSAFEEHLLKIAQKAGENLVKQLKRGKVTEAALFRAIRLNILDPSKTLTESLAALAGWNGLTDKEKANLYDLTKKARNIRDPQVRLSLLLGQMRVIYAATGIPPDWRDFVSSSTRSSAYSGMGTIFINATVGVATPMVNLVREAVVSFVTNPLQPGKNFSDLARSLVRAYGTAARRGGLAAATGATVGLSAARATGSKADTQDVGVLNVDALERQMDLSLKRIGESNRPAWKKAWDSFLVTASITGKILWRVIGAFDTVSTSQVSEFITAMRLNRNMRRQNLDPVAEWSAFMEAHESAVRHAVSQLGLSQNQASIEAMYRLQDAYYVELQGKADLLPFEYRADARREALTMIGNHAERQGVLTRIGHGIADFVGHRNFLGLGFVLSGAPIRTVANIAEYTSWYAPGFSLGKLLIEYRNRRRAEDGIGSYHLHAGSNWQFRRRMFESLFGHTLAVGLYMLLVSQPDDEEERTFGITTSYPWMPGEQVKFRNNKETPFTLYFGSKKEGGRKYLQFTRGVMEMLTFPAIAAKNIDDFVRKKGTPLESSYRLMYDSGTVGMPIFDSLAKTFNLFKSGSNDKIMEDLARKGSILIPGSSLARSILKINEPGQSRSSPNYLASVLLPAYAIFKDDGDAELRNALDEPVFLGNSAWDKIHKAGLPFGFLPHSGPQDPVLAKDFSQANYPIPPAPPFKTFEKRLGERQEEILKANGTDSTDKLYGMWIAKRAAAFKRIYREDPDPGENARDQRTVEELLKAGDDAAYKKRAGVLWGRATKEANLELQITEDE